MLGRASEASLVESVVDGARGGTSGSLLISGEPGIGKTALLAHARAAAGGALVLESSGAEGESHLAFAGLADLLRPAFGHVEALPDPQAAALRGALALGPPVPGDRFTAYVAALGVLAAAAEERPVVCIVDDAHWLDAESLEALLFVARRLEAEGVVLLLASRDGVSDRVDGASLPRLRMEGLAAPDAARLIEDRAAVRPAEGVMSALVAGAKGNPLALIELAGALSADQLAGAEPLPDPLPVGPYLREALLRPVRALPEATRRALLVASADDGATGFLVAALAAEGLSMADLEPAEAAGVVAAGPGGLRFSHPLVRAAVYQAADAPARRAAHRAHAASAAALGESALDRRAWHLAMAATGPDASAAAELEAAGGRAAARNGHAGACEAFEAAARLSTDAAERGRRLAAAGQSALAGGEFTRAGQLFDEVVALDVAPDQVLAAMAGRSYVETFSGSARHAIDLLLTAADRAAGPAPSVAASLLMQAVIPAFMRSDVGLVRTLLERADPLAETGEPALRTKLDAMAAIASIFIGAPRPLDPAWAPELGRQAAAGDPVSFVFLIGFFQCQMFMERYEAAAAGLDEVVRAARERSMPSLLPLPLFTSAEVKRRTGRLHEAAADAAESLRIAEDTGQATNGGVAQFTLALIDAVRGRSAQCHAHAERMIERLDATEASNLRIYADDALGLLALGTGELEVAVRHLRAAERQYQELGALPHPLVDCQRQDLVEALIRTGRLDEAEAALATLERQADATGTAWTRAAAARCRGLLAPDDAFEPHFAAALALHAETPVPFEAARTELCLGERRRLARRPREARAPLSSALDGFERLGAAPWADHARRELRAAGGRAAEHRAATADGLTPQELQVAIAVADGATNKEVATALLISPKTVEYHLAKVYAKLGVSSRARLARVLAD